MKLKAQYNIKGTDTTYTSVVIIIYTPLEYYLKHDNVI